MASVYTEFDVGDDIFVLFDNGIYKFKVVGIAAHINNADDTDINYQVYNGNDFLTFYEEDCFASQAEVIEKLLDECKERLEQ